MRPLRSTATLLLLLAPATTAEAGQIIAQLSGLTGTDHVLDFGANLYPNFTVITNEFPGVVFTHTRYFTTGTSNNLVGGFLTNDFSGAPDTMTATFASPISDLSFVYHQIGTSQASNFRVYLAGSLVDSFSYQSDQFQPNNYFGFTDLVFDELQIDFVSDFNIDTLAYNDAAPTTTGDPFCSGDGTGGTCPCLGVGAAGAGCPSSATGGAVLTASGSASFGADSFSLAVNGIPGARPGLCVKGSAVLGGGLGDPVGDGLLCTNPEQRSQVIVSDAGGSLVMLDWKGQPFGTYPGIANAGSTTYHQWWYRDPDNTCSGQGFNFTNAWAVDWQP